MLGLCDYLRLDHFRGFAGFWEVPAGETTAQNGRWMKGPGKRFFEALREEFGDLPFIAEDLGYITPYVRNLKNIVGLPGMRVFQFEHSPDEVLSGLNEEVNPERGGASRDEQGQGDGEDCVYYSGTHDNDTLIGWLLGEGKAEEKTLARQVLRRIYLSDAKWVIVPFQDLLGLGSKARMNTPGTSEGNWEWRMKAEDLELETLAPAGESRAKEPTHANKTANKPEGSRSLLDWLKKCSEESGRAPTCN